MPGTSGVDVAKHIREIESSSKNLPYTKIIAMTANVLRRSIQRIFKGRDGRFYFKAFQ
jgi:CheY-like chemotaxis protein